MATENYSIDAIEIALKRTKKALIEPFKFWKWIKLGFILLLISGGSGNFGNSSNYAEDKIGQDDITSQKIQSMDEMFDSMIQFWNNYQNYILIITFAILSIIFFFGIISNTMEFVLVHALVTNVVTVRTYFKQHLKQGFNLFILNFIIMIGFLSLLFLSMIPFIESITNSPNDTNVFGFIVWFFTVLFVLIIISSILSSIISLAIPLVIYNNVGIVKAIKIIVQRINQGWGDIIIYWIIRILLGIAIAIIMAILILIIFIISVFILGIIGLILGLIITTVSDIKINDALFWIFMTPYLLFSFIMLMILFIMSVVPSGVFMKYHLLTFLQKWYPDVKMPFFDDTNEINLIK